MKSDTKTSNERKACFQSCVSIMLTRRCNIRCRHCCVEALPANAAGADITLQHLREWVLQAAHIPKVTRIALTGGEPFLVYPLLRAAVDLAGEVGLAVKAITNGFWAKSLDVARRKLEPLAKWEDLFTLTVSIDRFHQEHIPLERIKNAIVAAGEVGIRKITINLGHLDTSDEKSQRQMLQQIECVPTQINTQRIHRTGRAVSQIAKDEFARPDRQNQDIDFTNMSCTTANIPLITTKGDVYACCGAALLLKHKTPLLLGDLHTDTLAEILNRSETDTVLHFIRLYGPFRLFDYLGRGDEVVSDDINDLCSLCLKLFASPDLVADLERDLCDDPAWIKIARNVAVDRLLYRNEPTMLARATF